MGRKFNFFAWATGKTANTKASLRRLMILIAAGLGILLAMVIVRNWFWHYSEEHGHEKGPHGGLIVTINKEEPHFHLEVLIETDGRMRLFLFGNELDEVVEVDPQTLIAQIRSGTEGLATSVILRPGEKLSEATRRTNQFTGRISPELVGKSLTVSIRKVVIADRRFSVEFELPGESDHSGLRAQVAQGLERELLLHPEGRYTQGDIDAVGRTTPSTKYKRLPVVHSLDVKPGARLCPVSRVAADPRVSWVVGGKTYQFCCAPCIAEFVTVAKKQPEEILPVENEVKQK